MARFLIEAPPDIDPRDIKAAVDLIGQGYTLDRDITLRERAAGAVAYGINTLQKVMPVPEANAVYSAQYRNFRTGGGTEYFGVFGILAPYNRMTEAEIDDLINNQGFNPGDYAGRLAIKTPLDNLVAWPAKGLIQFGPVRTAALDIQGFQADIAVDVTGAWRVLNPARAARVGNNNPDETISYLVNTLIPRAVNTVTTNQSFIDDVTNTIWDKTGNPRNIIPTNELNELAGNHIRVAVYEEAKESAGIQVISLTAEPDWGPAVEEYNNAALKAIAARNQNIVEAEALGLKTEAVVKALSGVVLQTIKYAVDNELITPGMISGFMSRQREQSININVNNGNNTARKKSKIVKTGGSYAS